MFEIENLQHMQLVISLSFVKLLWPFVRYISYSHDQDHVHSTYTCQLLHWKLRISSIPFDKIKLYAIHDHPLHVARTWAERNKGHAQESMMKKRESWAHEGPKYSKKNWTHEGPVLQKKSPCPEKEGRNSSWKEFLYLPHNFTYTYTSWSRFMTCFS